MTDPKRIPTRNQFPHLSYRGFLQEKYYYLHEHFEPLEYNVPYYMVLGALNDSSTDEARTFLRAIMGSNNGKYDAIYQEALRELDEEEKEKKR